MTFAEQVHLYETRKIRILNGGHQIVALPGELLSLPTIAQSMAHPAIHAFLRKVVTDEIAPHLPAVPGATHAEYLDLIDRRFSNPKIADTTRRVAFDGSGRQPGFILPSVREGLRAGRSVRGLALASAAWARYCAGTREDGRAIAPNDPQWETLSATARAAESEPERWLAMTHIYGELGEDPVFATLFATQLRLVYEQGIEAAINAYLEGP